ncbi:MAG: indolepyruvate ferredoxin oxidoreductase subunit alpha [Clostridia bacterium]|nr:indolepyruvate ferredoxin oxidoreductase subunit alpha [Clostridia bacterium]
MKELMTGNQAIARGAWQSGVKMGVGYPGTPSTEILEEFSKYDDIYAEWTPNEKVALEVAIGASVAGARSIVTMKHVGVNVAADPLMTVAYTGVNGGLILISADDPGMHSSQNEQDNRNYAQFAKIPVLEPSDSTEALNMVKDALEISENFDTPVMLRLTTRVAHSQSLVELGEKIDIDLKEYQKDAPKWVMVPAFGRLRRQLLNGRLEALAKFAETSPLNWLEEGNNSIGIITSGISYQYVKEVLPQASILKLGFTYPLPEKLIKNFAASVEKLLVIEELEPFLEKQIKLMGVEVIGKELFPDAGEFSPTLLRKKLSEAGILPEEEKELPELPVMPPRPPVLCAGCPHRGVFYALRKMNLIVTGDIGCYTLGSAAPLEAIDTCVCMGASIGMAHGISKVNPEMAKQTVAVIGDSTFMHSGITGLLDVIYNKGNATVLILDNRITAMTGHQENPGTGKTLMQQETLALDLEALVKALGVKMVTTVDPLNLNDLTQAIETGLAADEPSVVIARRPCALLKTTRRQSPVLVNPEACKGCGLCLKIGCPAISMEDKVSCIDPVVCTGCGLCLQVCKFEALSQEVKADV